MRETQPSAEDQKRSQTALRTPNPRLALFLAAALQLVHTLSIRAENRADYRFESYQEDHGRIEITTHAALFDLQLSPRLSVEGEYIYDAISGATPIGSPPLPGTQDVATVQIEDRRDAGYLKFGYKIGNHTLSPQLAYSTESDYESIGVSLMDAVELNDKNTLVSFGASHSFDRVIPNLGTFIDRSQKKDTTDLFVGINQILGKNTHATANLTLGYNSGYLSDPYKGVVFEDFPFFPPFPYTVFGERRPSHKFRQVAFLGLSHYWKQIDTAIETGYRYHHDSFGIDAHTASVSLIRDLMDWFTLQPVLRYHRQSEASFYGIRFPGDPSLSDEGIPAYYSADYRLSNLETWTFGLHATARLHEDVVLDFGYKRYLMNGRDSQTAATAYPDAHVFTASLRIWF